MSIVVTTYFSTFLDFYLFKRHFYRISLHFMVPRIPRNRNKVESRGDLVIYVNDLRYLRHKFTPDYCSGFLVYSVAK
jgi:hypothetical protein